MINWPVIIEGFLSPARGKLDQYEFWCRDRAAINSKLPLVPGNPYVLTASDNPMGRNKGIEITCKFNNHRVLGQFHRKVNSNGIWLGTNRTNEGPVATSYWHKFISLFGVRAGKDYIKLPVSLEFYPEKIVIIRLRTNKAVQIK